MGTEAYTYKELAEMWGLSLRTVQNRGAKLKIPHFKNKQTVLIRKEDALKLKESFPVLFGGHPGRIKGQKVIDGKVLTVYWRLSVYDEEKLAYIVKKCSLTQDEAKAEQTLLENKGFITRISPCA